MGKRKVRPIRSRFNTQVQIEAPARVPNFLQAFPDGRYFAEISVRDVKGDHHIKTKADHLRNQIDGQDDSHPAQGRGGVIHKIGLRRIESEGRDQDLAHERRRLAEQGEQKKSGEVRPVEGESAVDQFAGCQRPQIDLGRRPRWAQPGRSRRRGKRSIGHETLIIVIPGLSRDQTHFLFP